MPELVIQTLVRTFRCNPAFQEALKHEFRNQKTWKHWKTMKTLNTMEVAYIYKKRSKATTKWPRYATVTVRLLRRLLLCEASPLQVPQVSATEMKTTRIPLANCRYFFSHMLKPLHEHSAAKTQGQWLLRNEPNFISSSYSHDFCFLFLFSSYKITCNSPLLSIASCCSGGQRLAAPNASSNVPHSIQYLPHKAGSLSSEIDLGKTGPIQSMIGVSLFQILHYIIFWTSSCHQISLYESIESIITTAYHITVITILYIYII